MNRIKRIERANGVDVLGCYPSANDTLTAMIEGVTPENFVITLKFLNVKFGINRFKLSEMTGIPYSTLHKMFDTGIGYSNDRRTKHAIKCLQEALI